MENFIVHGYASKEKIWRQTDLLFFPTTYGEGFPFSVLEALYNNCFIYIFQSHWTSHLPSSDRILFGDMEMMLDYIKNTELGNTDPKAEAKIYKYLYQHHDLYTVVIPSWRQLIDDIC